MSVTMSTPYDEMHRTIWSEFEKCGWWVEKFIKRQGAMFKRDAWRKCLDGKNAELPVVEYKGPSGNRWVNYLYTTVANNRGVVFGYDSICYWECYGSFGAFIPHTVRGEHCLLITTSHFWQRLCERTDYQMQGVHTAEKFFSDHRACKTVLLPPEEGDTRRRVAIHYNGGSAYGVEVSSEYHVFEIRTYIDEKSMTGKKLNERKEGTKELMNEDTQRAFDKVKAYANMHPDTDYYSLFDHLSPDEQQLAEEHARRDGQKEMERQLAELRKTMNEEQAIAQYVKDNPVTYYRNRYGEHVSTEDPKMCELFVRLRESECKRCAEQDFQDIVIAFSLKVGDEMSQAWRDIVHPVFTRGYEWAWITVVNWTVAELPVGGEEIQAYKHREFVKFKSSVEHWLDGEDFNEIEREIVLTFAAFGFDRATYKTTAISGRIFGIPYAPEESAQEYINRRDK